MKKTLGSLVLVGLLGAAAAGCTVRGSAYATTPTATVEVYEEPPPPRVVTVTQRPGYIWIDGRWDYRGGRYVWLDGRYERQRANGYYQQGRWERRGRGHVWVEGRWSSGGGNNNNRAPAVRDHRRDNGPPPRGPDVRDHRNGR